MHNAAYAVMRCLSVCVSVKFVHCVKTNKDIFNFFYCRVATPFSFPHHTGWQYFDGKPPNGGIECRWSRLKS